MSERPQTGSTTEYKTPPSPCETANGGLGCGMIEACMKNKMACFDYFAYAQGADNSPSACIHYPEPTWVPTKEIHALMYSDGIKPMGVAETKRLHFKKYQELENTGIIG